MKAKNIKRATVLLLIAAALLLVCSKSSPLYPLNDWMDANIFFTAGKSMMNGLVLYRDAFDHKGPLLYFLYGVGWLICHNGFFGVYLLETAAFALFLHFGLRSAELFVGALSPWWAVVPGALTACAKAFAHGGSAEEFCLPFLAAALYGLLRFLRGKDHPVPLSAVFVQGVLAGCVLWIKFTMMGFFLAWVVLLGGIYLKRRWGIRLLQSTGAYLGGMGTATLPWLVYFTLNGAVGDWLTAYLYDNLFLYAGRDAPVGLGQQAYAFIQKLWWGVYDNWPLVLLAAAGFLFILRLWRKTPAAALALPVLAVGLAITSFLRGAYLVYYFLPYAVFAPLGLVPLAAIYRRRFPASPPARRAVKCAVPVLCLALCLIGSGNTSQMLRSRAAMPQWQFAARMAAGDAVPTLLNYGTLDGGFYTAAGLLPPCQYFCVTNMPLPEQQQQQDELLQAGGVTYIVALDGALADRFLGYTRCAESRYDSGEGPRTWYLYRKTI